MQNSEKREDKGMGYLLQYENVAWFDEEESDVKILDRRVFPREKRFVICKTYQDSRTMQTFKQKELHFRNARSGKINYRGSSHNKRNYGRTCNKTVQFIL